MPRCRSCRAEVFFVPSAATGSNMILNAAPTPDGNVVIAKDLLGGPVAHVLPPDATHPSSDVLYVDHHATCPDAEAWR